MKAEGLLKEQLGVRSLTGFGCRDMPEGIIAAGALVHYFRDTQKGHPEHIKEIVSYRIGDFMFLDESTCAHLELLKTMRRQSVKGSLSQIIDRTVTPMGSPPATPLAKHIMSGSTPQCSHAQSLPVLPKPV